MNCNNNQNNNNGCGCNCNPHPTPAPEPVDINMSVCDRNINMLPMLQTYTTKVLKPNIDGCCKKNILKQCMINCENYKYVIKWDFDLNGETITVPENCILEFDGGSLKNGTIIGQDTVINNMGDISNIFGENLIVQGTWRDHFANNGGGGGGLPDKPYDPSHFSGFGRKTLQLKDGSNILRQEDFNQNNTVYVVGYDFALEDASEEKTIQITGNNTTTINGSVFYWEPVTIEAHHAICYQPWLGIQWLDDTKKVLKFGTGNVIYANDTPITVYLASTNPGTYSYSYCTPIIMPENSVLEFEGGSISGGTLVGQETAILADVVKILGLDVNIGGTWHVEEAYPEWFGAKGDCKVVEEYAHEKWSYRSGRKRVTGTDDSDAFNKVLSLGWPTVATGNYLITQSIQVVTSLDGKNSGTITARLANKNDKCIEVGSASLWTIIEDRYSVVKNIEVFAEGGYNTQETSGTEEYYNRKGYGIYIHAFGRAEGCTVHDFYYGYAIVSYNIVVLQCQSSNNYVNIGLDAANPNPTGWEEQANAINIEGGNHISCLSGINLNIGSTPWHSYGQHVNGVRTLISGASFDLGCVSIRDYGNISISDCYFEAPTEAYPYNIGIHGGFHNIDISKNYLRSGKYGVYITEGTAGISIRENYFAGQDYGIYSRVESLVSILMEANRFWNINYSTIYLFNAPFNIICKNNEGYSNTARSIHLGVQEGSVDYVNSKCKIIYDQGILDYHYYFRDQPVPWRGSLGYVTNNGFSYIDDSLVLEGSIVEVEGKTGFKVTSGSINSLVPGIKVYEGVNTRVSHIDYEEGIVYLKATTMPDSLVTELHIEKFDVTVGVLFKDSNNEDIFVGSKEGAIIYDYKQKRHFFWDSYTGETKNIEYSKRSFVIIARTLADFEARTSYTKVIEIVDNIDLGGETLNLGEVSATQDNDGYPATFLTLRFKGGSIFNGTIILNNTGIEGISGNVENYLGPNLIVQGTYRFGQRLFDPATSRIKTWNSVKWIDDNGYTFNINRGTFAQAQALVTDGKIAATDNGYEFFATDKGTAGMPIYYGGDSKWYDATGTEVTA